MPARNVTTSSLAYNPADFEHEAAMEAQLAAQVAAQAQAQAQGGLGPTRPNSGAVSPGPTSGVPPAPGSPPGPTDTGSNPGVYGWLLAWGVFILLAILLARTQLGYRLLYYGLALLILFLVLTNYRWFQTTLAPLQTVSLS